LSSHPFPGVDEHCEVHPTVRQQHASENLMIVDISGNMRRPDEDVNDHKLRANTPKPFQG
jgi:hypothetical protein